MQKKKRSKTTKTASGILPGVVSARGGYWQVKTRKALWTKMSLKGYTGKVNSIAELLCGMHKDKIPFGIKNKLDVLMEGYVNEHRRTIQPNRRRI